MMTPLADANRHLRDADLMRLLDGEESARERARNAAHLESCVRCSEEVRRLRGDAAIVRGWLDRAEFEATLPTAATGVAPTASPHRLRAPAGRRGRRQVTPWLKAAAVLLFVAAPVAAIPALRERIVTAFAEVRGAEQVETAAPAAVEPGAATIRFEPVAGTYTVRIDAAQAEGTLRVERTAGDYAVLGIEGAVGAGPVVSGTTLQIRNDPAGAASYVLQVPAGVSAVAIHVDGRLAALLDAAALQEGVQLPIR